MSGKLPALTGAEVSQALQRGGSLLCVSVGATIFCGTATGAGPWSPAHAGETIGPGLMSKVLRDAGLDREQFRGLLG